MRRVTLLVLLLVAACGGSSDGYIITPTGDGGFTVTPVPPQDDGQTEVPEVPSPPTPVPPQPTPTTPVIITEFFEDTEALWKPAADEKSVRPGKLVVLLDSKYSEDMECKVPLTNGGYDTLDCIEAPWTQVPWSCRSNGDRPTLRGDYTCDAYTAPIVECVSDELELTLFAEGSDPCKRYE